MANVAGGVPLLANVASGMQVHGGETFDWNLPQGEITLTGNALPYRVFGRSSQVVPPKEKDGKEGE